MFKLLNVYNKNNITVQIKNDKDIIDFNISTLISKRNKDEIDSDKQFLLLNAYLDYKGHDFKSNLMQLYKDADDLLMMLINRKDINPLPYSMVHNIINMFDPADVYHFVADVFKVKTPSALAESFDKVRETDGDGTRAQTYLKKDYYELAALNIILKAVLPVIGQFGYLKNSYINGTHKEYILFNFIVAHPIYKSPAMVKLYQFVEKLVEISFKKDDVAAIRVIEKRIPKEEMPLYILSSVVFSKISIATIVDDGDGNNVITRMHNYIHNKLNVRKDVQTAIRDTKAVSDMESGDGEKSSIIEAFRLTSELAVGEFNKNNK